MKYHELESINRYKDEIATSEWELSEYPEDELTYTKVEV